MKIQGGNSKTCSLEESMQVFPSYEEILNGIHIKLSRISSGNGLGESNTDVMKPEKKHDLLTSVIKRKKKDLLLVNGVVVKIKRCIG
jgi:hypothetical protein